MHDEAEEQDQPCRKPVPPGARVVLVVESNPEDQAWLKEILTEAGNAVETAMTGAEAIRRCAARPFDAVTLDLFLPDMSGWEVLRSIRAGGPNEEAPVIVTSVAADQGIGIGFGVRDFLTKPVSKKKLQDALWRAGVAAIGNRPVMVVDDDPDALNVAASVLKHLGFRPVCHQDAQSALRSAEQEPPDAVVLDLLMPGMDGFEFLRRFRIQEGSRDTPVIVWTAKTLTLQERAALQASSQGVVLKGPDAKAALLAELKANLHGAPVRTRSSVRGR